MSKEKRLDFVTLAQLFSMVLIVLSHSVPDNMEVPDWMPIMVSHLQKAGLVTFMVLSGFLVAYTEQLDKYGVIGFWKRRTKRLLIPYFGVSLLLLFPKYLLSAYASKEVNLDIGEIICQLLTPRNGILPHLWFLFTLWCLCLLVPLFLKFVRNIWGKLSILFVLLVIVFSPATIEFMALRDIQKYAVWFCAGLVLGNLELDKIRNTKRNILLIGLSGCVYIVARSCFGNTSWVWFLYEVFALVTIVCLAIVLENGLDGQCQKIGKYMFPIYIFSLPVQNVVNILLIQFTESVMVVFVLEFVFGILVPLVLAKLVEKIDTVFKRKCLAYMIGL